MQRFIQRWVGFLGLQCGLLAGLLAFYDSSDSENYLAETVPKHRRLETTGSPKVVLVGGSSLAFGVHSEILESALRLPVVNMGLAAGLGLEFMLREVTPHLQPGDTVILSPEYDHFARGPESAWFGGRGFDPEILSQVLVFRPASIRSLGSSHLRPILLERGLPILGEIVRKSLADLAHRTGWLPPERAFSSQERGFNAWGDHPLPDHLEAASPALRLSLVADERGFPSNRALRAIRRFASRMNARGVRVLWSYPPKPSEALKNHLMPRLTAALENTPGLTILDRPEDQGYPQDWFYDSANHLTFQGAAARTRRWIDRLAPPSPEPQPAAESPP